MGVHPDRNDNSPDATAVFQKMGAAYETLSDHAKRSRYDNTGFTEAGPDADRAKEIFASFLQKMATQYVKINEILEQKASQRGNSAIALFNIGAAVGYANYNAGLPLSYAIAKLSPEQRQAMWDEIEEAFSTLYNL